MRTSRVLVVVLLVAALAACGTGGDDADHTAQDAGGEAGREPGDEPGGGVAGGAGGSDTEAPRPRTARSLVRTAELSMTVEDVRRAADDAVALAVDAGGFQSGGSLDLRAPASGSVELRVPAARFEDVLAAVAALGELADQSVGVEDVTDAVVDLGSRIVAATASVERVRSFLASTTDVTELAAVEAELTVRESQLESLLAEQRQLAERVDLATITARFGEEVPPALASDPEPSEDIPGFARALRYGWVVLVTVFQLLAAAAGFLLPFAVLAVPTFLGVRVLRRRRRRVAAT